MLVLLLVLALLLWDCADSNSADPGVVTVALDQNPDNLDRPTRVQFVAVDQCRVQVQKFRGTQNVDNLYSCSILAVDLTTTGALKWHYQTVRNDIWEGIDLLCVFFPFFVEKFGVTQ